ncbi:MAG: patatin-like phospholipase family protein [Byssovorax sp.]
MQAQGNRAGSNGASSADAPKDHVLYFVASPSPAARRAAEAALAQAGQRLSPQRVSQIRVAFEQSAARALAKLRSGAAEALVIDARGELGPVEESTSLSLLRGLFDEHEVARVIGREHTFLVVEGDARGASLAFEAGRLHLGGVIVAEGEPTWETIWERIALSTARGRGGKIALCLAGGGTEGLLYELGVLRALQRFLPSYSLCDVDILCGISAGAILGGLLANRLDPQAISEGLAHGTDRLDAIDRGDLFDFAFTELGKRAARLSVDVIRGKRAALSALFRVPPAGIFAGDRLGRWLERQLTRPGMIDDFDALPHKLFVGTTDQDTSEHVVFGAPGAPRAPIHQAIRASTALVPFYAPEKIAGRYYVDGGFTRTTNMRVAVQEGATLVILVDPLVPVSSESPGQVAERGAVFVAMQGLKALINGRFDKAVPTLRAMYPQVAFHLFQPGPATRRVMAGSPMKYNFRQEIADIAERETMRDIRAARLSLLARDFERHGVRLADPEPLRKSDRAETEIEVVA